MLKIVGDLDLVTVPNLAGATSGAFACGVTRVLVDMADVSFMDSAGLAFLVSTSRFVDPLGGQVSLRAVSPKLQKVFRVTHTDTLFCMLD